MPASPDVYAGALGTVALIRASSVSEAGALRIVLAVVAAAALSLGIGAAFGVADAVVVAVIAVVSGFASRSATCNFDPRPARADWPGVVRGQAFCAYGAQLSGPARGSGGPRGQALAQNWEQLDRTVHAGHGAGRDRSSVAVGQPSRARPAHSGYVLVAGHGIRRRCSDRPTCRPPRRHRAHGRLACGGSSGRSRSAVAGRCDGRARGDGPTARRVGTGPVMSAWSRSVARLCRPGLQPLDIAVCEASFASLEGAHAAALVGHPPRAAERDLRLNRGPPDRRSAGLHALGYISPCRLRKKLLSAPVEN